MPRLCTLSEPCADTATVLVTPGGERERERGGGGGERETAHHQPLCNQNIPTLHFPVK